MPFKEEGALKLLRKHAGNNFTLGSLSDLKKCSTVIVSIGTFLTDSFSPDLSALYKLLDDVLPLLRTNSLFVLRSTIHPNGTENIVAYIRKRTKKNIHLVYAPERISEGFAIKELYTLPQIIGSNDKKASKKAERIFQSFAPQILHTDPLSAELAKLALNTYRYSKFALANELMMIVDFYGRDIHAVLDLANNNYSRGGIPRPGFAAGPCLVKDSFFLRYGTPFNTLITGSYTINNQVIDYLLTKLTKKQSLQGKKVAVLGLSFKKNIDDDRGSLSLKLIEDLKRYNCSISVHDPYLANTNLSDVLKNAEAVIVAVDHDEYKKLKTENIQQMVGKETIVCDLWNVFGTQKIFFTL
jgi:UDP-N-acetyl-D-mannosaminuronic acid dehydrogenase